MTDKPRKNTPAVRIVPVAKRTLQLRYTCPESGKEIRISTGTHDEAEAEEQREDLLAKLRLGIDATPKAKRRSAGGPGMSWEDFRERYSELHVSTLRDKASRAAESRLDIAERILKPKTLADVASREALERLKKALAAGAESRFDQPRKPFTVKNYVAAVVAALNWARDMGWLETVPKRPKIKTSKLKHMKGRPITAEEFERMLAATAAVVGDEAAPSWQRVLRGAWESGLRIGELMNVHWHDPQFIVPDFSARPNPVLQIPADMQKNATEESIPLLPGFEDLLEETPAGDRKSWAFNPASLQTKIGRKPRSGRPAAEWVGKVIGRIGEKAGVVVEPKRENRPARFAGAHDLRRSCADRLVAAGVPEREVADIMRHASVETTRRHYAPGNVQRSAATIRERLKAAAK